MKFIVGLLLLASLTAQDVFACSRVLWNTTGANNYVGRNMDWFEDMKSNMWVLPRGMERSGLTLENPHQWKSKYGSLIISGYESVSVDGINEQGLAMHVLYLPETEAPKRDVKKPGLTISLWGQYYLDNFKSVQEVADFMKDPGFQLVMTEDPASKKKGTIHLALDDSSGDSLILELVNGKVKAYHDRKYTVMTNQPEFPKQLENLKHYKGLGGNKPLPGSHEPIDRFVRGAFYSKNLPKPKDQREAIAALMSIMRNTAAPFGLSSPDRPNVSTTIWRTVEDLNEKTIYYDSVMSPSVFWVSMKNLNFDEKAPVMRLQVADNYELSKEVSGQFKPAEMFHFIPELKESKKLGSR